LHQGKFPVCIRNTKPFVIRSFYSWLAALLVLMPCHAVVDQNADGMGDLWQLKYNAQSLVATDDDDGDGQSNQAESVAGTNPFEANAVIQVSRSIITATTFQIFWPSMAGKRYQVECSNSLNAASWGPVGDLHSGTDEELSAEFPLAVGGLFYRVKVSDVDSDADGVSDWEAIQAGLQEDDHAHGHHHHDNVTRLLEMLNHPPVITLMSHDNDATEPGPSSSADAGSFMIHRSGGIGAAVVQLVRSGDTSLSDHAAIPTTVSLPFGVHSATVNVMPLADSLVESDEAVILGIQSHASYSVGTPSTATVVIRDFTQANGTGLWGEYFNEVGINSTTPPLFTNRIITRVDPLVAFTWGASSPAEGVNADRFSARWSGEVLPEYSQTYTFKVTADNACRLWVGGQLVINNWPGGPSSLTTSQVTGLIDLIAGERTPIVLEYYEVTNNASCTLKWQSVSQADQIIPTERLFPQTPPQILNDSPKILLQNSGIKTWQITASGNPTSYASPLLPPGWSLNEETGLLTGPTNTAGTWSVTVTATNAYGSGSAILELNIVATTGLITHESWANPSNTSLESFAWNSTPGSSATLSSAEIPEAETAPIAQRLRGYLTAPETGMYRFWISGDDNAELLIANDHEPINVFSRATLASSTIVRDWPNAATSPILWLEAGQRYYVEARSVNLSGSGHLSVGWLLPSQGGVDPMAVTAPSEVIPSYALSPWLGSTQVAISGTLFTTQMTGQNGNLTSAYGSATLQMNEAETEAVLRFSYANLTSPKTAAHVHSSAHGGAIIFDVDTSPVETDGSYIWTIAAAGAITLEEVRNVIKNGQAYLNVHSALYPAGEISGTFRQQTGSQTFVAPIAPPAWTDDSADRSAAVRFLTQATYGASEADIAAVQSLGYEDWIDAQSETPSSYLYPEVFQSRNLTNPNGPTYSGSMLFNAWWKRSITAPDQLRQRVAFALSQIFVVSEAGVLDDRADTLSSFYDMLLDQSFGNMRDTLEKVTLHPAMGRYLDMLKNERPDKSIGRIPNENYAREVLQLFSVGLYRMHPDGSLMLDSLGSPIVTYDQETVIGFSHAFTGWNYNQANAGAFKPTNWSPSSDWLNPMREVPGRHDVGTKRLLNNVVLPGLPKITTSSNAVINLNPTTSYSGNATVRDDDEFQNLARQELDAAHDAIFAHPNFGPFLCKQLIQRLVTSTPSRAYIYRVSQVFADNGSGVRGDMKAVIKAILLDYEARSENVIDQQGYGKQKEPLLRVTNLARAFPSAPAVTGTYQQTDGFINITTSAPHRLISGNPSTLQFTSVDSGSPSAPTSGAYNVVTNSLAPLSATTFSVRAKEWPNFTYTQSGNTVTVTLNSHGFTSGMQVYLKFPAATSLSQLYPITFVNSNSFTVTVADSATHTTNQPGYAVRHTGGYVMSANSDVVTITCNTNHHLSSNDVVFLRFTPETGQTTGPSSGLYAISRIDDRRFTITHSTGTFTAMREGLILMSPQSPAASISGQINTTFSNFSVGDTETDLAQTPLRSPTVFNFFLPDYQHPGTLASNGLLTPEFQLTSDTTVIRQSNFLFEGIYKPSSPSTSNPYTNTSIHSSFRSGNGAIALDFTPWMQTRPGGSGAWTDNANVSALVDELSILLTADQLSAGARTIIVNFVSNNANIAYTNGTATDAQKINRLRGIIHLIATSPDFTIQR
jgi:uncharacterized protein (DUF1800 family)